MPSSEKRLNPISIGFKRRRLAAVVAKTVMVKVGNAGRMSGMV
jgi:hypothetical protein